MARVCPSWLSFVLYNPIRKAFTNREKILRDSGIRADSVVLEIGAGNGFITETAAACARRVYAVELQAGMARKLGKRVQPFGDKVEVILCDVASCALGEGIADVCLMYYSFHEVGDKGAAADNIARAVRRGGSLAIYEPTMEVGRRDMEETIRMCEARGFKREERRDGMFTRFVKLRRV